MNNDTDMRTGADHRDDENGSSALSSSAAARAGDHTPGGAPNPEPYRICFVCTGNICRSPIAQWVLCARLEETGLSEAVAVDSAGTGDWHVGEGADSRALQVLDRHGYPSRHVARQFVPADLLRRDLVIALDSGHLRTLRRWASTVQGGTGQRDNGLGDTGLGGTRVGRGRVAELRLLREFDPAADPAAGPAGLDVPDPYYGSLAGFEECLAMVQDAMPGLLSHIGEALETRAG